MSWKPEVIIDASGAWVGNHLRFATLAEAEAYVIDLIPRWAWVRETRVVQSDDPANYAFIDGKLESLSWEN
jgi:hypothetical protein